MKTKKQQEFEEKRKDLTDREIMMELLYSNWIIQNRMERNRSNTSKLVWWLIALPFIFGVIMMFAGVSII